MNLHGTTILGIIRDGKVALGGDGQITYGDIVLKSNTRKIRKLEEYGVLVGFAGATADAMILLDEFQKSLGEASGNLENGAIKFIKKWRSDKILRKFEAMLTAFDKNMGLTISGNGDLITPEDGIVALGSGGPYALASARALLSVNEKLNLELKDIVKRSLEIAADICIYTNHQIIVETL